MKIYKKWREKKLEQFNEMTPRERFEFVETDKRIYMKGVDALFICSIVTFLLTLLAVACKYVGDMFATAVALGGAYFFGLCGLLCTFFITQNVIKDDDMMLDELMEGQVEK